LPDGADRGAVDREAAQRIVGIAGYVSHGSVS
jgi:hypothetical protein